MIIQRFVPQPSEQLPTPSPDLIEAEKAAVEGMQAFFQIEIDAGKDAWLNRFCSISTENGCALIRMGADRLWQKYADAKTSIQATAKVAEQVSRTPTEQVWKVEVTLSEPLPGSNKTQDEAFVLVVKTEDAWKFDRFLLEPEVQALLERQKKEGQQ